MRTIILLTLLIISDSLNGQKSFNNYFTGKVLRFDFMFSGMKFLMMQQTFSSAPFSPLDYCQCKLVTINQSGLKHYEVFVQKRIKI
jgi:hypothetical protein